jgi:hypothetical protein
MFDPDRFIADCRSASAASGWPGVREVVSAAVSPPAEILHALGEPRRAGSTYFISRRSSRFSISSGAHRCANYPTTIGCGLS